MHAHDARRYIGDMLAWVHQALANERELLTGLFGDDSKGQGDSDTGAVRQQGVVLMSVDCDARITCRSLGWRCTSIHNGHDAQRATR